MGTRIDYDEALANPQATKARLAAGEKLTLVRDGVPFTHLSAPEDLDGFEPRQRNPAARPRSPFVDDDGRVLLRDEQMKTERGRSLLRLRKAVETAGKLRTEEEIDDELTRGVPAAGRRTYGYEERARDRRRLTLEERWEGILDPPTTLRRTLGTPDAQNLLADLRGRDVE